MVIGITSYVVGLLNSINVCTLSSLMVFFLFLTFFPQRKSCLIPVGLSFIVGIMLMTIFVGSGIPEILIPQSIYKRIIGYSNLVLAGIFFVLSVITFRDWMRLNKDKNNVTLRESLFLVQWQKHQLNWDKKNKFYKFFLIMICPVFLSSVVSIINSLWPVSYDLLLMNSSALQGKNWDKVLISLILYAIGSVFFLAMLWAVSVDFSKKKENVFSRMVQTSLGTIIFSSLSFTVALGLFYIVNREIFNNLFK